MCIDAHVHFLVYNAREHLWVTDELGASKGTFCPVIWSPCCGTPDSTAASPSRPASCPPRTTGSSTWRGRTPASKGS